jgi:APA family basic amino acid/polyamine antiporter
MPAAEVSGHALGIVLAVGFAAAMGGLLIWMFRLPRMVPAQAARARRGVGAVRRILVPTVGAAYSQRGVELACRLGLEQKAEIVLANVIEVPRTLPLDAPLPQAQAQAEEAIEQARAIVELRGLVAQAHIERAREAVEGIIRAARHVDADLIVMGTRPHISAAESVLGRTADALLRRAPVEIIIDRYPD